MSKLAVNDKILSINGSNLVFPVYDLWTPEDEAGFMAWYDCADLSTITTGPTFTLADKLNSHDLTQTIAGAQPATGTRTENDLNVLDCDGGDYLQALNFPITGGNVSVIAMSIIDAISNAADSIISMDNNSGGDWQLSADNASSFIGEIRSGNIANYILTGGPYAGAHIMNADWNFTTNTQITYVDAVNRGQANNYNTAIMALQELRWMTNRVASQSIDGAMCEMIIYDGTMPESVRQKAEGYLAWKWGKESLLPVSHPYKSGPPTN